MFRARALVALLALTATSAAAQADDRVRRIGFLSGYSAAGAESIRRIFVDSLRELGYRDGKNVVFVDRYADGRMEKLPMLAQELVGAGVEVIATQTTPAGLAAKRAQPAVAVVTISSGDALASGLVRSLAHPGGNVTGLSFLGTELAVKQLELLRQIAPTVRHVGFLANPDIQPERGFFGEMQRASAGLDLRVSFIKAATSRDYDAAFAAVMQSRVDGLLIAASVVNHDEWPRIVRFAGEQRLPAVYPFREFADAGGLLSYGFSRRQFYGRAASYVDRILRGAKAGDLPLEQPATFELVINLKAAERLGLAPPPPMSPLITDIVR
jgi:putative ABC transport system substrate-binding protein